MSIISPNMNLLISVVGVDSGLLWEMNLNSSLTIIDGHNHTPGSGVQIPPDGLLINANLPFGGNSITGLASVVFAPQSTLTTLDAIYVSGVDLFFNDGSGNIVQITSGGSVNATSSGISSGSATAGFVSSILVVNQAASTPGNIQCGSILIGNNTPSSNFVTISAPNSLASNYGLTLPQIPGATSFLQLDTSGNIGAAVAVSAGITSSNIAANTILGSNIAANTIAAANIVPATITTTQIASATVTGGNIGFQTITSDNIAAANFGITSSSGSYSTSSTSFTTITNLSATFGGSFTTQRPVFINFVGGQMTINTNGNTGTFTASFRLICSNGLTTVTVATMTMEASHGNGDFIAVPCGAFNILDPSPHGGTYTAQAQVSSGSATFFVTNVQMQLCQVI